MTTATLPTEYEAARNADGSWDIHNVPIFGEVPAKAPGGKPLISKDWLRRALKKDEQRRASGYSAPAHIRHNKAGTPTPERAGGFRLTRVETVRYEDDELDVVFADLTKVPDATYQRIKRGELPYRSVEILDPRTAEINSLALLDSEVPFFRFPNLAVGVEKPATSGMRYSARHLEHSPVIACAKPHQGRERGYLFHAAGVSLMDTNADTPTPDAETVTPEVEDTASAPEADAAIEEASTRMFSLLENLSTRLETFEARFEALETKNTVDVELDTEPSDPPSIAPEVPVSPQQINDLPTQENFEEAKLHGRLMALEARLTAMDDEKAAVARFNAACEELKDISLSTASKESLRKFAALGQDHLDAVVATFKADLPRFPAPTLDAAHGATASANDPAEVAAYANDPNKLARARHFAAEFADSPPGMSCDLKTYLEINVERPLRADVVSVK